MDYFGLGAIILILAGMVWVWLKGKDKKKPGFE